MVTKTQTDAPTAPPDVGAELSPAERLARCEAALTELEAERATIAAALATSADAEATLDRGIEQAREQLISWEQQLATAERAERDARADLAVLRGSAQGPAAQATLDGIRTSVVGMLQAIEKGRAALAEAEREASERRPKVQQERATALAQQRDLDGLYEVLKGKLQDAHAAVGAERVAELRAKYQAQQARLADYEHCVEETTAYIARLRERVGEELGTWPELAAAAVEEFKAPTVTPAVEIITAFMAYLSVLEANAGMGDQTAGDAGLAFTLSLLNDKLIDNLLTGSAYGPKRVQHIKLLCHNLLQRLG